MFDIEANRAMARKGAAEIAYVVAADMAGLVSADERSRDMDWPFFGDFPLPVTDEHKAAQADKREKTKALMADFIRAAPGVPPEALYRYVSGQGLHMRPADDFNALPAPSRMAYGLFALVLVAADALFEQEIQLAAESAMAAQGTVYAAALEGDATGTMLEQLRDPLAIDVDRLPRAVPAVPVLEAGQTTIVLTEAEIAAAKAAAAPVLLTGEELAASLAADMAQLNVPDFVAKDSELARLAADEAAPLGGGEPSDTTAAVAAEAVAAAEVAAEAAATVNNGPDVEAAASPKKRKG